MSNMKILQLNGIRVLCLLTLIVGLRDVEAAASNQEVRCLALTLYWEARAGGRDAMVAVGSVVLNRRNHPAFPNTICGVVRHGGETPPCQFSYWCDGEPEVPQNNTAWRLARKVAVKMLTNPPEDPTGDALFYHAVEIANPWTVDRTRTALIGGHIFYR
jgi:spore germination cell wall hydrolase CwlJ-like protein